MTNVLPLTKKGLVLFPELVTGGAVIPPRAPAVPVEAAAELVVDAEAEVAVALAVPEATTAAEVAEDATGLADATLVLPPLPPLPPLPAFAAAEDEEAAIAEDAVAVSAADAAVAVLATEDEAAAPVPAPPEPEPEAAPEALTVNFWQSSCAPRWATGIKTG